MRRQPILVAGLAATMLGAIPAGVLSQQPAATFRAGVDAVAVEASVRRNNRPVTGLKAGDFQLLDNGVPQQISDLTYERLPIDVTVLLDVAPASPRCSTSCASPCVSSRLISVRATA